MVLREIHCAELELAGSPPWRRHSSVFQQGEPVTWRAIWNWGWGRKNGTFHFCFVFVGVVFFVPNPPALIFLTTRRRLWSCILSYSTNIVSRSVKQEFAHLYMCLRGVRNSHPCNIAFLKHLSPLTAQLLYSTQLYHFCRVEWKKGKAGIL